LPKILASCMAIALTAVPLGAAAHPAAHSPGGHSLHYPVAPQGPQTDVYFGVTVPDPYRWLEDTESKQTQDWITAENHLTFGYLETLPKREAIQQRLTKLWNYERYGVPFREGDRYFYAKNDGLQNQAVYYTQRSLTDAPKVLIDPNTLSKDGTIALTGFSPSRNGHLVAYGLSAAGSDWQEWRVRDAETGTDLSDHLKWIKFSNVTWTPDNQGFYYSRYDEPKPGNELKDVNYYQKLFYHRLGTAQAEDRLVYERKDQKEWAFSADVTEDGRYLLIYISQGTERKNRIYVQDLSTPESPIVPLFDAFDAEYGVIGNDGPVFYVKTTNGAPRSRAIAVDLRSPEPSAWREVVPQAADNLESITLLHHDQLVASYLKDAYSHVRVFGLDGKLVREVDLPGIGSVGGFGGHREDAETFYAFTGFTTPSTIYRYDLATGHSGVFRAPKVAFDPSAYETKQVFYASRDGTRVPMFLTYKKGLQLNGHNPTYLYGYGGFNIPMTPGFSVSNLEWMEMGGVYAVANIRGGGEYGETWHLAGTKLHKQNVFDDFISAAEWLIAHRYTSPQKLAIGGGSNGGLLVGACVTQRPDLFAAACPAVGVMDMLRFHLFTIGWGWVPDYGSVADVAEFKALYAYSPVHNVKPGKHYPAMLITTGDHDDRVFPAHSFKFAATVQAAQAGEAPVLIRIETRAGHGAGKPTSKVIEEIADRWAFLHHVLRMD